MLKTNKIVTAAVAAATLIGGIAAASDASAQGRYRRDRGGNTGAAVAAGVAGLALGAALANNNRGYSYGYAPGYYGGGGVGYYGGGYGGGYYDRGYYAPPRYYAPRGAYYGGPRTCMYWNYDRWGRAYQVPGRC